MTVGIGAVCQSEDDNPKVVAAADRMMTKIGMSPKEYEHTKSKIEAYEFLDECNAIVLGSGMAGLIEMFTNEFERNLKSAKISDDAQEDEDTKEIESYNDIVKKAQEAYQSTITDRINNRILGSYGLEFEDLTDKELRDDITAQLSKKAEDRREELRRQLRVILAGVYEGEPFLFEVGFGDFVNKSATSFCSIGSGGEPASTSLIQSSYDECCGELESIMTVFEAKKKAEKAQGVGDEQTDIVVVEEQNVKVIGDNELNEIEKEYEDYYQKVTNAREKYITDAKQNEDIEP